MNNAVQEPKPYGYLWFTHHMEQRFTHYKPNEDRLGMPEITAVYKTPRIHVWEQLKDDEIVEIANKEGWNVTTKDFPCDLLRTRVLSLAKALQYEFWKKANEY